MHFRDLIRPLQLGLPAPSPPKISNKTRDSSRAPAASPRWSRLRRVFDGSAVAASTGLQRIEALYRPYHAALRRLTQRAQKRFGLEPNGVLNASTLEALNVPVAERVQQIIANMERWRWLPPELPADRIQVNIAAAVLTVFHEGTPTLSMRAVTGRPDDMTPMLQSQIQSIVFNPPWNVPSTIATKELWPKEKAHPGYFKRNDFIVIPLPGGGNRLQQKAGPKAALGRVKFDFVNKYGVYLHDTPSHSAFGKYARMVSHGCVRLEHPVVLAKAVMDGDPKWTPDLIDSTLDGGDTVRAPLANPIAVFLLYWTAYVGPDGSANFRADPYDWDHALMQRIVARAHRPCRASAPVPPAPPANRRWRRSRGSWPERRAGRRSRCRAAAGCLARGPAGWRRWPGRTPTRRRRRAGAGPTHRDRRWAPAARRGWPGRSAGWRR